jgi:protein-S-isoprenylcysteine O-methyltransferase Ste14
MSALFAGLLLKNWIAVGVGVLVAAAGILFWLWPRRELREREPVSPADDEKELQHG